MKNQLAFAQITNTGSRQVNEDSIGIVTGEENSGFIVCDGLGGHGLGEVASKLVVDVFRGEFDAGNKRKKIISDTLETAQQMLLDEQKRPDCDPKGKKRI